jgi:putative radical SAM enzyme (TIGR03279 family)
MAGVVKAIEPHSTAFDAGLQKGDVINVINGHHLRDVIDAQFYSAEDEVVFEIERGEQRFSFATHRAFGQSLGIEFEHPTFDIDIRRCNNLCPFCFVLQNAPRMRRTLYIKDDDYRYSFLFGHYVTLTNLSNEDWARIAEQRLSPLYVSVHCTDLDIRRKCLRNATAPNVLQQLRWLADHGIETHTQLVITPGLNDGAWVEQSVRALAVLHPHVITATVVPVGLSKHHKYGYRAHTPAECAALLDQVDLWQAEFMQKLGTRFVFATDEWYLIGKRPLPTLRHYEGHRLTENGLGMVRVFLDEWRRVKKLELASNLIKENQQITKSVLLVTAPLFAPVLRKVAKEFSKITGIELHVLEVTNRVLGESITVAGLMMGKDVIEAVQKEPVTCDLLVLPRIMFDHPDGIALDDVSPLQVAQELGTPLALADLMGDVLDAIMGRNNLMFHPADTNLNVPVVREGGWAVEKYL